MSDNSDSYFCGFEEAMKLVNSEPDPVQRMLMLLMTGSIGRLALEKTLPSTPFDLLYLVKVMRMTFSQKAFIKDILDGRATETWVDTLDREDASKGESGE